MKGFCHARLGQMKTNSSYTHGELGIVGDQDGCNCLELSRQRFPVLVIARANHDKASLGQATCGLRPVSLSIVCHQHQRGTEVGTRIEVKAAIS